MDTTSARSYGAHFQIKWSTKNTLDWECFDTFRDAQIRASELATPKEEFTTQMVSTAARPNKGFQSALRGIKSASRKLESPSQACVGLLGITQQGPDIGRADDLKT
jgi:hypothetical protein